MEAMNGEKKPGMVSPGYSIPILKRLNGEKNIR